MKKIWIIILTGGLILGLAGVSGASTYTFAKDSSQYWSYRQNYIWGIDSAIQDNETIVGATLFFDDIRKTSGDRPLYVTLLDDQTEGLFAKYDTRRDDEFYGLGERLAKWKNPPTRPRDVTYTFDGEEIEVLNAYVSQGIFGLGFDPDSSFFMNGIKFTITTESTGSNPGNPEAVPEPATILLLGTGMLCIAPLRKKINKKFLKYKTFPIFK